MQRYRHEHVDVVLQPAGCDPRRRAACRAPAPTASWPRYLSTCTRWSSGERVREGREASLAAAVVGQDRGPSAAAATPRSRDTDRGTAAARGRRTARSAAATARRRFAPGHCQPNAACSFDSREAASEYCPGRSGCSLRRRARSAAANSRAVPPDSHEHTRSRSSGHRDERPVPTSIAAGCAVRSTARSARGYDRRRRAAGPGSR